MCGVCVVCVCGGVCARHMCVSVWYARRVCVCMGRGGGEGCVVCVCVVCTPCFVCVWGYVNAVFVCVCVRV